MIHPALLGVPGVPHLIHHGQRVAAVGVHRVIEAHRGAYRVQSLTDFFCGKLQRPGNLLQSRLPVKAGGQSILALEHPVGHVPDGPGYPDGAVVPEVAADFSRDHGYAVCGKLYLFVRVKVGDGLDEADAAHLKQVVGVFAPLVEALNDGKHQPQVALDELLTGVSVSLLGTAEQYLHFNRG